MRKILILTILLLQTHFLSAQKIGVIESYDPNLKHAHLKGLFDLKFYSVEDLNYNIKPFIDSLYTENQIKPNQIENFDLKIFENFDPIYGNRKIEENLKNFCELQNYDALIIIKKFGNKQNKYNLIASELDTKLDFGLVTFENTKKSLFYYNNLIFLYYTPKNNKLTYPARKRSEHLFYELNPRKFDETVFDLNSKSLQNKTKIAGDFLTDLKNRYKLNFKQIVDDIKKITSN